MGVVEVSKILREHSMISGRLEGHGRRGKGLGADYVLVYRNTKLAVTSSRHWCASGTRTIADAVADLGKPDEIAYGVGQQAHTAAYRPQRR